MARRPLLLALLLALVCGCGGSTPATLTEQGLQELRSGQYNEAIATCSAAIGAEPNNTAAYLYRGRAYQFRNAMGDPKRAIADFGEAIRLAPDSSDAYYSRALVYRDLGEDALALADDRAARHADGTLQEVYRGLPDTTPAVLAKARQDAAAEAEEDASIPKASGNVDDILPKSEEQRKEVYDKLKEEFEPGFGSVRVGPGNSSADRESTIHRYRRHLPKAIDESTIEDGAQGAGGGTSAPLGTRIPQLPPLTPGDEGQGGVPSGPTTPGNARRATTPSSPFQPRVPLGAAQDGRAAQPPLGGGLQSPFGQRPPAPTGYREPLGNPFSQPSTGPFGGQSRQFFPNPSSNPAVRPDNPRDFTP